MINYRGKAQVSQRRPRAFAICDRCGFLYNHDKLSWQNEWAGPQVINKHILVCRTCLDDPSNAFRTIVIPPDPVPIRDPRTQNFNAAETDYRITMDGVHRITMDGVHRIVMESGDAALDAIIFRPGSSIGGGPLANWDPVTYFGSDLDSWWDFSDASKATLSGSNVTAFAPTVGTRTATSPSTGPTWSLTARNNLPGLIFSGSNAERMTFSAAGLPGGTPNVTLVVVGFASNITTAKTAFCYGGGFANGDTLSLRSINITGSPTGIQKTSGQYAVPSNAWSTLAQTQLEWKNNDRIVIGEFFSSSMAAQSIDGDSNLPVYMYAGLNNVGTGKGRIGNYTSDTNAWDGVLQCCMIIRRTLTQIEKDKLSSWLGGKYNLRANLSPFNPYASRDPTVDDTLTSGLLDGYNVVWSDSFESLSLRTGNYYRGNAAGYNDPSAVGTWSPCGFSYMTNPKGFGGFGQDWFLNPNYNWQALDPTFPPLGMIDISPDGVVLFGSEAYPAVRSAVTQLTAGPPYLGALISTTQSMKIGAPFARRIRFTLNSTRREFSFPACWSIGDRYNGAMTLTGDIALDALTVNSVDSAPPGQSLDLGVQVVASSAVPERIIAFGTGTGGAGTYTLNDMGHTLTANYPHQEMDDFEQYGVAYSDSASQQHSHINIDGVAGSGGVTFNFPPSFFISGGPQVEVVCVTRSDFIYFFTNGTLTVRATWPAGSALSDKFHTILNMSCGFSWEQYPGRFNGAISNGSGSAGNILTVTNVPGSGHVIIQAGQTVQTTPSGSAFTSATIQAFGSGGTTGTGSEGTYLISGSPQLVSTTLMQVIPGLVYTPQMTVRSVEILAPPSNTTGIFPSAPPVPVVTWGGSYAGGSVPSSTPSNTIVASLSGASTYTVIPYLSTFTGLTVSGSNLMTSGTLSAGTYLFYIRGVDSYGVPGIAPKLSVTIT